MLALGTSRFRRSGASIESSWRDTIWKPDSESKRLNSSSTIGCGESRQTLRCGLAEFLAIVVWRFKANEIVPAGQGSRGGRFPSGTGVHDRANRRRRMWIGEVTAECGEIEESKGVTAALSKNYSSASSGPDASSIFRCRRFAGRPAWRTLYKRAR